MTSANLAFVFSLWLAFACTAHAQLFDPDTATERDDRPAGSSSTTGADVTATRQNGVVHTRVRFVRCQSAAVDNGLPVEFFARLIWQESRLRPNAVGPLTRGGGRTAAERLLLDPFDPVQALPKSAEFLRPAARSNLAISGWRRRPITLVPDASRTGLPRSGHCRRRRKPMSALSRAVSPRNGRGRRQPFGRSRFLGIRRV